MTQKALPRPLITGEFTMDPTFGWGCLVCRPSWLRPESGFNSSAERVASDFFLARPGLRNTLSVVVISSIS